MVQTTYRKAHQTSSRGGLTPGKSCQPYHPPQPIQEHIEGHTSAGSPHAELEATDPHALLN
jgi:hypothetical protein